MEVQPPSITRLCPVICFDRGDTKNAAAFAISDTEAALPMGVKFDQVSA